MNTAKLLSSHSTALPAPSPEAPGAPERIQLLPPGTFSGRDGRGPYRVDNPEAVIAATREYFGNADIPLDYNHQTEHAAENGKPAPAAGWIKGLESRPDGIWARVEWTEPGARAVAAKEFRYVSPVFFHKPDGQVLMVQSAALTNLPNLDLKALSAAQRGADNASAVATQEATDEDRNWLMRQPANETAVAIRKRSATANGYRNDAPQGAKEYDMNFKEAVAQSLGLSPDASEAEVIAAAQSQRDAVAQAGKALNASEGLAGLIRAAHEAAAKAERADNPDPAKYVPMSMHESVSRELAALKAEQVKAGAESLVRAAQSAGKLTPAMTDWGMSYAAENPTGFKAWMETAPDLRPGGGKGSGTSAAPPDNAGSALNAEEKAVCAAFGLSEDEFQKAGV